MPILHKRTAISATEDLVIVSSQARMPGKCWGRYRHVGLMRVPTGGMPRMISARCGEIVDYWGRLHAGSGGPRTAFARALAAAGEIR